MFKCCYTCAMSLQRTENVDAPEVKKPALRRLFDLLIAPVVDILDKLVEQNAAVSGSAVSGSGSTPTDNPNPHVIIVPDKQLKAVPFGALLDYGNKPLCEK